MKQKNNWYAISGVASSGKTTIIKLLEKEGYNVVPESATEFVLQQFQKGHTIEELRKDEGKFQEVIFQIKRFYENLQDPEETTFIDRGMPDTIAFYKMYNLHMPDYMKQAIEDASYKKVFLFERLPLIKEDFRPEPEEEIARMDEYNRNAYKELGHNIVHVPVMPIEKRLQFILDNL